MHHIYFLPCVGGYVLREERPRRECVTVEIPRGCTFHDCTGHSSHKIPRCLEGIFSGRVLGDDTFHTSADWRIQREVNGNDIRLYVKRRSFCSAVDTEPLYLPANAVRATDWLNDEGDLPEIAELVSNVLTAAEGVRIAKQAA